MKKIILLNFLILFFFISLNAQSRPDSLSFMQVPYTNKGLNTYFNKQLSTFSLNTSLRYSKQFGKFFIGLNERFNSTVIKSGTKNIKDEQHFSLMSEYKLFPSLSVGNLTNYYLYDDDRKLEVNSVSNINSSLFARIAPQKNINLVPFIGAVTNKQIGIEDKGLMYGSELLINNYRLNEFNVSSSIKFFNEDISPRKNTFRFANVNLLSRFEKTFRNIISANYSEQRMDFYLETDSLTQSNFDIVKNIQSRTEASYFLTDRFSFLSENRRFDVDLEGTVGWRNIDRDTRYVVTESIGQNDIDTKIEEFRLEFASTARINLKNFHGNFRVSFSEKEEKHIAKNREGIPESIFEDKEEAESFKNNKTQYATLSATGAYSISKSDQITLSLFHRKLLYDTPSENNSDDRDELLSTIRSRYTHRFSPFFSMFVNLEGSINHIVYIFAERSSNNNKRRVIKLTSGGSYTGKNITTSNVAEVSANYTVYDFEDLAPNFNSFSFRQFLCYDSTSVKLTKKMNFDFYGYMKLSEQGDFRWSEFSGRPARFLNEYFVEPAFKYKHNNLTLGFGLRYFSLLTYNYNEEVEKELDTEYTSIGPVSSLTFLIFNRLNLRIKGWYEFISNEQNLKRELINLRIRLDWKI